MGGKKRVTGNKMSVTDINDPIFAGKSAKRMARDLLGKYHRGPGDTIESAAYRVQERHGVLFVKANWRELSRLAHTIRGTKNADTGCDPSAK